MHACIMRDCFEGKPRSSLIRVGDRHVGDTHMVLWGARPLHTQHMRLSMIIIRPDYHILVQSHFIRIRDTPRARNMVYTSSGLRSDEWDTLTSEYREHAGMHSGGMNKFALMIIIMGM